MYAPLHEETSTGNLTIGELNVEKVKTLIPVIIYTSVLMICGVIGNAVVIYVYCFRFKASNHRYFTLTLGICDFITSAICMPFLIVDKLRPFSFTNTFACKSFRYIIYTTALVSIFTLFFIAVERYRKICRPLKTQITLPLARRILFVIVLLAATVFALPSSILYGRSAVYTGKGNTTGVACFIADHFLGTPYPIAYNLTLLVIVVLLGAAMVYCYCKIVYQRFIRAKAKQARKQYRVVDSSAVLLSSAQNGDEVSASANDGLKDEHASEANKWSTSDDCCSLQDFSRQPDQIKCIVHGQTFREVKSNDMNLSETEHFHTSTCHTSTKHVNDDIDYHGYVNKEYNGGCFSHAKSSEVVNANNKLSQFSGKKSVTLLTTVLQKRAHSCIVWSGGTSVFRECEQFPVCTHSPVSKMNEHTNNYTSLSGRINYTAKCLSASNLHYTTRLLSNERNISNKRHAILSDSVCLDSRVSSRKESLLTPERCMSSDTTLKNEIGENREVLRKGATDKERGLLPEVQCCDYITCSHVKGTPKSDGLCTSQSDETEHDIHTDDTHEQTIDDTARTVNDNDSIIELNGSISENRKTKQSNRYKRIFIKRSRTKSAKIAESRDASVIRVTKMLFVITIVYFASFIPHLVLMNIVLLDENFLSSLGRLEAVLYYVALRSFLINAVANPFIYNFMDKKFRKECKSIWNRKKTNSMVYIKKFVIFN